MKETLICVCCGEEFVFGDDEQEMYASMGYAEAPKRCKRCRGAEKALCVAVKPEKEMFKAICDECGKETLLPFKPKGDKPVYCRACFESRKRS